MDKVLLKKTVILRGMNDNELDTALSALKSSEKEYLKDEVILHAGSTTTTMGLVLEGSVRIESNDMWGNRTILSHVGKGHVFAETYAMAKDEPMLVDAVANEKCKILMLRIGSPGAYSQDPSLWRLKVITNILDVFMRKNLILAGRNFHTSPKSIRGRVMAYLNSVSLQEGSNEFDIPFDRQQLADYLNVERTALSKELGKMQKDGLIKTKKRHFSLLLPFSSSDSVSRKDIRV
jgi:CRP-like cAMP-binding protein